MRRLRHREFWSGLLFAGFGAAALLLGAGLRAGSAARMGPGYVPRLLGWLLLAIGAVIGLRAAVRARPAPIEAMHWRPVVLLSGGLVMFGLLLPTAGLAAAISALVLIAALAGPAARARDVVAAALVMVLLCVLIFKVGLEMNVDVIRGLW